MRRFLVVLLAIIVVPNLSFAAEVKNLQVKQEGDKAIATYNLVATAGEQAAEVSVSIIVNGQRKTSDQLHLSGDFGKNVSVGIGKRIAWNAMADLPKEFDGELSWDVKVVKSAQDEAVTSGLKEIIYKSQHLTAQEREKAHSLFSAALELWKNKEFEAATMAFDDVLKLDPANPAANFYYGDCLQRNNDLKAAYKYLNRALVLGEGTQEGYRAKAALKPLEAKIETSDKAISVAFLEGDWTCSFNNINYTFGVHFSVSGNQVEDRSSTKFEGAYTAEIIEGILVLSGRSTTNPEFGEIIDKYNVLSDHAMHKFYSKFSGAEHVNDIDCKKK